MADDLKRVGLVFKADGAVDFKKSLTEINQATTENYAAFKNAKSQYDKNTTSIQKLTDRQKYLADQTDSYKSKVSLLETELYDLENAEEKNSKAISEKRTQLLNAQTNLNKYEKGLADVTKELQKANDKFEQAGKKVEEFGKKSKDVGESLSKNVTAPIIAVGAASVAAWKEMDKAYDNIASGTGAVGDSLYKLYDVYDEVFSSMPDSAENVSTAIADLNTRFGFTEDALASASEDFLKFARVNNTDVSSSISLVARAMGDAGLDASEYGELLDILTVASQATGISIDSLTSMVTKYGAPMRALGYDTKESIAIFSSWEKAGVNTEIAFSGMKTAISNWSKQGKDARVEFQKTIDTIADCPDIASATTLAIETFGSKAGPDLADAIQGGRFSIEEMMSTLEDCSGAVDGTFNEMADASDTSTVAMNNLALMGAELGDVIMKSLSPVLDGLVDGLKKTLNWFKGLDDNTKLVIVSIVGLVAALGPLLFIIGAIAGPIGNAIRLFGTAKAAITAMEFATLKETIATISNKVATIASTAATIAGAVATTAATAATWLFNAALAVLTSPITWVVAGIAALIAIIYLLIKNWNTVKEVAANIWDSICNIWKPVGEWFKKNVVEPVAKIFKDLFDGIFNVAKGAWDKILGLFALGGKIFSGITDGISSLFKTIVNNIIKGLNTVISIPFNNINGILNTIRNFDIPVVGKVFSKLWGQNPLPVPKIPMLAKGGTLLSGTAIVGEAGAELLQQTAQGTKVTPLTKGGGANQHNLIDYDKLAQVFILALTKVHPSLVYDKREVAKMVWEVTG